MKLTDEQRQLVEDSMRLVSFTINKLRMPIMRARLSYDDARQAGYEGLCKAVTRWNPERAKLSTYADFYIRGQILKACAENNSMGAGRGTLHRHPELWDATISLEAPLGDSDSLTIGDLLPATNDTERCSIVADIWGMFSEAEQRALTGVLNGQKRLEIARMVGTSHQAVTQAMKRVRRKTEAYLACDA